MCIRDRFQTNAKVTGIERNDNGVRVLVEGGKPLEAEQCMVCLLYTSDAADERSSVDLGGRRIIKKKQLPQNTWTTNQTQNTIHKTQTATTE